MVGGKITEKLRSTQGTSIFFGILFFLIASILSIVMLNGAVTVVKSVQSDKQAEQNFLACSSAAKTLRDAITDTEVTRTQKVRYAGTSTTTEEPVWTASEKEDSKSGTAVFGTQYLTDWLKQLAENQTSNGKLQRTLTLTLSGTDLDTVSPVTAEITVSADTNTENAWTDTRTGKVYYRYDITVILSTGTGVDACTMNMKLNGTIKGDRTETGGGSATNPLIVRNTTTYTWTAGRIIYGTDSAGEDDTQ